ncbi:hypothetical protein ACS0TY_010806 [Phlomoides rotata]
MPSVRCVVAKWKQFGIFLLIAHLRRVGLKQWNVARSNSSVPASETPSCECWHKPPLSFIKVNVDAPFFGTSMETGVGMVIRDEECEVLITRSMVSQGLMEVDEGVAWGVLEVMRWEKELGFDRVIVETDSKRVYVTIVALSKCDTMFGDFISQVTSL